MNPQYPNLFSPLEIRGKKIKNRIYFPALYTGLVNDDFSVSDAQLAWITARAKGGAGLIVSEVIRCNDRYNRGFERIATISNATRKEGWRKYADLCKHHGTVAIAQLTLGLGKQAVPLPEFGEYAAPSAIPLSIPVGSACKGAEGFEGVPFPPPRELTTEECDALVADFAAAAARLKMCGFDGLEIHGCHGYLISEFISPLHNQRADKYGGSFEKRLTMPLALIKTVREVGGDNFILGFRMSTNDHAEGGYKPEDYAKIAKIFEANGVDYIDCSSGGYWAMNKLFPGANNALIADHVVIKKAVKIPVFVPNIHNAKTGEEVLASGSADMVGFARSLVADPDLPRKVLENKTEAINRCTFCNTCIVTLLAGFSIRCAVNPIAGWERHDPEYWPPARIQIPRLTT